MSRTISVFEHGTLRVEKGDLACQLTPREFDALVRFNDEREGRVFRVDEGRPCAVNAGDRHHAAAAQARDDEVVARVPAPEDDSVLVERGRLTATGVAGVEGGRRTQREQRAVQRQRSSVLAVFHLLPSHATGGRSVAIFRFWFRR